MINFDKTFLEQSPKIIKCSAQKLISLKYGRILAIINENDENDNSTIKALFFDKNFQLKCTLKLEEKTLLDVIQLKTKEILFYFIDAIFKYNLKSLKLIFKYKTNFANLEGDIAERVFELSDSTIAFCFSASYGIDIYNNNLEYIKTIKTKFASYSVCEINNNNIAFNCTFNYKSGEYEIGF